MKKNNKKEMKKNISLLLLLNRLTISKLLAQITFAIGSVSAITMPRFFMKSGARKGQENPSTPSMTKLMPRQISSVSIKIVYLEGRSKLSCLTNLADLGKTACTGKNFCLHISSFPLC